jgi:hypothetical protein
MAYGSRINVLLHGSDDPLAINTVAVKILFRPPKLPYVRPFLAVRLYDASTLHGSPPELIYDRPKVKYSPIRRSMAD